MVAVVIFLQRLKGLRLMKKGLEALGLEKVRKIFIFKITISIFSHTSITATLKFLPQSFCRPNSRKIVQYI